jgi:hypothetical protein
MRVAPLRTSRTTGISPASVERPDVPLPREQAGPVFRVELGRAGCDEVLVLEGTEIL